MVYPTDARTAMSMTPWSADQHVVLPEAQLLSRSSFFVDHVAVYSHPVDWYSAQDSIACCVLVAATADDTGQLLADVYSCWDVECITGVT